MVKKLEKKNVLPRKIREGEINFDDLPEEEKVKVNNNLYKTTKKARMNKDGVDFGKMGRPSTAQLKLIEKYKINHPNQLVKNTIKGLITEELPNIKKAIESLEKFSDVNIYEVLPKELDSFIRDYNLIITDYYCRNKGELGTRTVIVVPEGYIRCMKCGDYKNPKDEFYTSKSDIGEGYLPVCKKCATKMFREFYKETNDIKEALILISQKLDIYVHVPTLNNYVQKFETLEGKEAYKDGTFFGLYLNDLSIDMKKDGITDEPIGFANSNLCGIPFKKTKKVITYGRVYDDVVTTDEKAKENVKEMTDYEYYKLRKKWGIEDKQDLRFLENSYSNLEEQYDLSGLNSQMLVKQLCFEELNLHKIRKSEGNAEKALKTYRDLMNDLNLTPKKEKKTKSGSFDSLGSLIQAIEKEKPFINTNPAFEDVDNIKRMRDSMIGAKDRTLQRETEYVKKFEENYADYSVDIDEEFYDDDV